VGSLQETGLITRVERNGVQGYELAHEGMIGAVIRLGEKVQDRAYRANQLLERRVNEWLGNGRSARYLFNGRELWALEREKRFLVWGSKREQKQQLIAKSKQLFWGEFGLLATGLMVVMGIWGWLNYTVLGNITQVCWRLAEVSQQGSSFKKAEAAIAFAKDRNFAQASKLANQIDNSDPKADALIVIAEAYGKLNQPEKGLPLLKEALTAAQKIDSSRLKALRLRAIAEAYGKLNQPEKGLSLLKETLTAARKIEYSDPKADALIVIAEAYGKLNQPEKGLPLLKEALTAAQKIDSSRLKALRLRAIAEAYSKFNQPEKGLSLLKEALIS
jgi:tetratricopeptide (TPR) repeat protein